MLDEVKPDAKANWLNLTRNEFDELMPLVSKVAKAAAQPLHEKAAFKLFSLGVSTSRDDWVYGATEAEIRAKTGFLIEVYNTDLARAAQRRQALDASELTYDIKWTRSVKTDLAAGVRYLPEQGVVAPSAYRPFDARLLHFNGRLVEVQYQQTKVFGEAGDLANKVITFTDAGSQKPFMVLACQHVFDYHFVGAAAAACGAPLFRYDDLGTRVDNITDWSLKQFSSHYKAGPGKRLPEPTKEGIFHYVYAVLHDPAYREKYAQNLKREFPRVPLYGTLRADFWRWADWGRALMDLHIGYEQVPSFALKRTDIPDERARAAGQSPKCILKSDPEAGRIVIDSETTLGGVPAQAWAYRLGNRCAIDWVLDQHKEKKPKDPTIRAKFDTYRFADHKERVIDLLMRVTTVSVETVRIVVEMKEGPR
jgi:predicted helicase